ncbi:carbon-nitrogen hydrolase family protein [Nakamurella flavida]|uniref:Carbon-nitrogen hydrolase family protein n=1 Tax=Nakamurella flavida TaxID=363630 RepID=A0A938YNI8_9ACTN|nr:carbon-nitrogen hydrolase family protein [Nakamurella flavida]MBM9476110.1 carbon-nitrogen hydrolase family protein [Nakamurella flavida]MDP9777145.1 putative amidohydrolase [Nakamurella flavida]
MQLSPVTGDVGANAVDHARWVAEAAASGARVVVFPQLSLTGYDPDLIDLHRIRVDPGDPRLEPLRRACRHHGVHAFVGAPVTEPRPVAVGAGSAPDGPPRIGTLHIDIAGRDRVAYLKRYLDVGEIGIFGPGVNDAVLPIGGWRLGLATGRDVTVADHHSRLAYAGVEVSLVSGLYVIGAEQRLAEQMAAATRHGKWVVLAQFCGGTGGGPACGGSGVWAPGGHRVRQLGQEPGVVLVDVDLAQGVRTAGS